MGILDHKKPLEFLSPPSGIYVDIIIPLAIPGTYTYHVPEELVGKLAFGMRVEIQFAKNKRYSSVVVGIHHRAPEGYKTKPILSIIDETPVVTITQWKLWQWMANYYACTPGEVMQAALPANLKLNSETILTLSPLFDGDVSVLSDKEFLVVQALSAQQELTLEKVQKLLDLKSVYAVVKGLMDKRLVYLKEELQEKFVAKKVEMIRLTPEYNAAISLSKAFEQVARAAKQEKALLAFIQLSKKQEYIRKQDIYELAAVNAGVIHKLVEKGIFEVYQKEVSRLGPGEETTMQSPELAEEQKNALSAIQSSWQQKKVALLHGVTGSGKTRIYAELIQQVLEKGGQSLYLLPEIALTTQIIERISKVFGDKVLVYHSRMSDNERVEVWNQCLLGKSIILGARSALFLPFQQLQLIIVDEEHDTSYKQHDPNPRYNARDTAIFLSTLFEAKVLLGTATPSLESYYNARQGKYSLVNLQQRFGGIEMPQIIIADLKEEYKKRQLQSHFSTVLLQHLKETLQNKQQAILFQNRRGYSPMYQCVTCDWHAECIHCDVSLTYHKHFNGLKCHYCGYSTKLPEVCPACGSGQLKLLGFGTEKIEDELKIYLPEARIGRMDLETVRTKNAHARLINDFEEGRLDILVGTQMVTKGLDFDRVGLVGVISADQLLQFPDFRAVERAFQMMVQVAGRAGRKEKRGKVIIQAFNAAHPVIPHIIANDYQAFFEKEIQERQVFKYPPFFKLVQITLKHKSTSVLEDATRITGQLLREKLGDWVLGPSVPHVSRIKSLYICNFLIKMPVEPKKILYAKKILLHAVAVMQKQQGLSGVRVNVDVDPM